MGSYSSSKVTAAQSMRITSAESDTTAAGSTDTTGGSDDQGLTLLHFSAGPEPFLTQNAHPIHPLIPRHTP